MGIRLVIPWPTAAFLSGLIGSLLTTRLVQEIGWRHRYHAVGLEVLAIGAAIVGWTIWARRAGDWKVLAIEGMGTVLGTWIVLS